MLDYLCFCQKNRTRDIRGGTETERAHCVTKGSDASEETFVFPSRRCFFNIPNPPFLPPALLIQLCLNFKPKIKQATTKQQQQQNRKALVQITTEPWNEAVFPHSGLSCPLYLQISWIILNLQRCQKAWDLKKNNNNKQTKISGSIDDTVFRFF